MKPKNCILFEGGMRGMGITFHLSRLVCELHRLCPDLIVIHDGTEQEKGLFHLLNENGIESFNYALNDIGVLLHQLVQRGYSSFIFHAESYGGCRLIEPWKKRYQIHVLLGMNAYKYGSPYRDIIVKFIRFRYGKIVDTWVFFSQQSREEFCRSANVYDRTFVIPWGVEDVSELKRIERYRDIYAKQEEDCYQPGVKYVFYAAQFYKHKKHSLLVNLLESYLRDESVKLVLAGNGPEMDHIHQLCINKGIAGNVIFLGRVPRKEFLSHLKNAFCSLVLSKNETFGHCILEPLQLGIPVISTPTGVAPTAITDFSNGLTIPLSSKKKWAKAVDGLINGHLKFEAKHQELYTWPVVARLYADLYSFSIAKI